RNRPLGAMRIPMDAAVQVIHQLLEGMSIRSTERLTGVHQNTIMDLLVHVGEGCARLMDKIVVDVCVDDIQADEVWSFVQCKEKTRQLKMKGEHCGDSYCFVGIERTTKMIVAWHMGKRSPEDTEIFARKLRRATAGRFQVTTDGWGPYRNAIPNAFEGQ